MSTTTPLKTHRHPRKGTPVPMKKDATVTYNTDVNKTVIGQ